MTPDQKFARYVRLSLAAFALTFVYFIAADIWLPLTPQARVMHPVTQVTPRISGTVSKLYVTNNQQVEKGQPLLSIDPAPFRIAHEKAQLTLQDALRNNQRLDAEIKSLEAEKHAAKAQEKQQTRLENRAKSLFAKSVMSAQERDRIHADFLSAGAKVAALNARLDAKKLERGELGDNNLAVKMATNQLENAKLNLSYTTLYAEDGGMVANLQVTPGTFAKSGVPLTALVTKHTDLIADFREKSLLKVTTGTAAKITFDALPGRVFDAAVSAFEAGVSEGQLSANGLLADPEKSDRWVRDAQRQRIHLNVHSPDLALEKLPSGARATVQLLPQSGLGHWLGTMQIRFISLLHYIY